MYKIGYILSTASVAGGANRSLLDLIRELKRRDKNFSCFVIVNAYGTMVDELEEIGVKCYVQTYAKAIKNKRKLKTVGKRFFNIYAKNRLRKIFEEEKPDVIHNNSLPTTIGMEVALRENIPYICHIRENVWSGLGMQFYTPKIVQGVVNQAACVIAISDYIKQSYNGFNDNNNTVVLNDGIVTDDYYTPKRKILSEEIINILIAGAINPQKGQKQAVEAIERLTDKGYNIRLTILGTCGVWQDSTSYADNLVRYVNEHDMNNVSFMEPISDLDELRDLRSRHDINLICSSAEGLGRTTIESMLSGALTIAADVGATPEIIEDGSSGLLYESGNAEKLAECIEWALNNKEEATTIAESGQKKALERFSIEGYAEKIEIVYSEIINGSLT